MTTPKSSQVTADQYRRADSLVRRLFQSVERDRLAHGFARWLSQSGGKPTPGRAVASFGLSRAELRGLAEDVATHLDLARRANSFTVQDWEKLSGLGLGQSNLSAADRAAIRDDIDFSLGAMDATRFRTGRATFADWDDLALVRILSLHLTGYLKLQSRQTFGPRDLDVLVSRCAARLSLTTMFTSDLRLNPATPPRGGAAGSSEPRDVGEGTASVLGVGTIVGDDVNGRYMVIGDLASSDDRRQFMRIQVKQTPHTRHAYSSGVTAGDTCVLKLHHEQNDLVPPQDLPVSEFIMGPIARLQVGHLNADVLPVASFDLFSWWQTQVHEGRQLDASEVLALACPMAAALGALHAGRGDKQALVHGDVKLSQFLMGPTLLLSDLDMAVPVSPANREARSSVPAKGHTFGYLPPDVDPNMTSRRRDSWALGVCWHLLLTGLHPAEAACGITLSDYDRFRAVSRGDWAIADNVDAGWRPILAGLLTSGPRVRPDAVLAELLTMDVSLRDAHTCAPGEDRHAVLAEVDLGDGTRLVTSHGGDEGCVSQRVPPLQFMQPGGGSGQEPRFPNQARPGTA